jgi:hypothetical protein
MMKLEAICGGYGDGLRFVQDFEKMKTGNDGFERQLGAAIIGERFCDENENMRVLKE